MKRLALVLALIFLAACAPRPQEVVQPNASVQQPNITVEQPKPNVTVQPEPKDETIKIASTPFTMYNAKKEKFQFRAYTLELLYVASDGSACQIRINGQSNWYGRDEEIPFDEGLKVRVMQAFPTHGYTTGDSCQVALIG